MTSDNVYSVCTGKLISFTVILTGLIICRMIPRRVGPLDDFRSCLFSVHSKISLIYGDTHRFNYLSNDSSAGWSVG